MRPEHAESVAVISTNDCFHFGCSHGNFDYMSTAELHLHLEGTVDRETVMLLDPGVTREAVDAAWRFTDFAGFLECFKFIAQRMRGPRDYALITRRMMERLARQGITYAEVTLGAGVVLWRGFDFSFRVAGHSRGAEGGVRKMAGRDLVESGCHPPVRPGPRDGSGTGRGELCGGWRDFIRHRRAMKLRGPALPLREAYRYARDAGLRLTAHAGETDGPESIRAALEIGAERIGHGIRAVDDPDLMRRLREERIPLEVCITSNVKTGAVASLGRIRCGDCSMRACRSR